MPEFRLKYIGRMNQRMRLAVSAAALAGAVVLLGWLFWPKAKPTGSVIVGTADVPVVMHTSGGRLEVATVSATESFRFDAPAKALLGVDLGKTVSQVQAKVVYRYYIDMAVQWPIRFSGTTAVVEAGEIKPTVPVAFDTATMQKQTMSGWARFDKRENLDELERRMSPELAKRAMGYQGLALESARKSVGDFVRTWLIKEQHWKQGTTLTVRVVFPGEPALSETTTRPPANAP